MSFELTRPETEFKPWEKIYRWSRDVVVTEKLDGSNASVVISDDGTQIYAGSRTRWIVPSDDNFGFAAWVQANHEELLKLGPGNHYGEWWGAGIQRRYGLNEKRFSLFNTYRWSDDSTRPKCCGVVPTIYQGLLDDMDVEKIMTQLKENGSVAAPGFKNPEGIVIFHTASKALFKKTFDKDAEPKNKPRDKDGNTI